MHINDVRDIKEYARLVDDIKREDLEYFSDGKKAGFHWTDYQYDAENERLINNIRRVKNFTVGNMYVLLGFAMTNFGLSAGGTSAALSNGTGQLNSFAATSSTSASVGLEAGGIATTALTIEAGTDLTTPTGGGTYGLTAGVGYSTVTTLTYANNAVGLQWSGTYPAGTLGATGTVTTIGEFGLTNKNTASTVLWNRLAIADGNAGFTTPIGVNNTASYGISITLVI